MDSSHAIVISDSSEGSPPHHGGAGAGAGAAGAAGGTPRWSCRIVGLSLSQNQVLRTRVGAVLAQITLQRSDSGTIRHTCN